MFVLHLHDAHFVTRRQSALSYAKNIQNKLQSALGIIPDKATENEYTESMN